jgi:hypothetical protein
MANNVRQRALREMQHRAVAAGFRRGRYSGLSTRQIRADALARRAESVAGKTLMAHDPRARKRSAITVVDGLVALGLGVVVGYAISEWFKHSRKTHVHGLDVLAKPTIH